jgi:pilus assembly protein Flp/PilA
LPLEVGVTHIADAPWSHIAHGNGRTSRRAGGNQMILHSIRNFVRNDEGQDLLEYALLVALIALVAIGAVGLAGQSVNTIFSNIAGQLGGA